VVRTCSSYIVAGRFAMIDKPHQVSSKITVNRVFVIIHVVPVRLCMNKNERRGHFVLYKRQMAGELTIRTSSTSDLFG